MWPPAFDEGSACPVLVPVSGALILIGANVYFLAEQGVRFWLATVLLLVRDVLSAGGNHCLHPSSGFQQADVSLQKLFSHYL